MGFGRFVCVALPFLLSLASLICLLATMLSGVANHNIDMFSVDTKNMSISSSSLASFVKEVKRDAIPEPGTGLNGLTGTALNSAEGSTVNFTAKDFGLADSYKVFMWNYCSYNGSNTTCTKAKFNWAATSINVTYMNQQASALSLAAIGKNATLPTAMTTALKSYVVISKWTQVVYIFALVLTFMTLVAGLFGFCSRAGSCFTYIISGLATTATIAASLMATLSSAAVVAAVRATAKMYGVNASLYQPFLRLTWVAVVFSMGAGLFWLFSVCCCKGENRHKADAEKFGPTRGNAAYTPIHDPHANTAYAGQQQGVYNHQMTSQRQVRGAGYEPYTRTNV